MKFNNGRTLDSHFLECATVKIATLKKKSNVQLGGTVYPCPPGLVFVEHLNACDYPSNVACCVGN